MTNTGHDEGVKLDTKCKRDPSPSARDIDPHEPQEAVGAHDNV